MAKLIFLGAAQARSQITTLTIGGTWADGETVTIRIGGKTVTYVCVGTPLATVVAAGLQALANASSDPEFTECDWEVVSDVITATSPVGVPVTISASDAAALGTITPSTTQTATGPHHWDNVDNWSTGAVPTTADEVFIESSAVAVKYGLPTSLTLGKFVHKYGSLGLPDRNTGGYSEYRVRRAVFTCLDVQIGVGQNNGPTLCRIDLASAAAVCVIFGSGPGSNAIDMLLNNALAVVSVIYGAVVIAGAGNEVASVGEVRVARNATATLGEGVTMVEVVSSGNLAAFCNINTLTVDDGQAMQYDGTISTLLVRGGRFVHKSPGTITTATVGPGTIDCSQDIRERTITDMTIHRGGLFSDPYNAITVTNGVVMGATANQLSAS